MRPPQDNRPERPEPTDAGETDEPQEWPDLALFALAEEINAAWRSDPSAGRAALLAALRAYPEQADALLTWMADDLHDAALDTLITARQQHPQARRVAERRAPYGEGSSELTEAQDGEG